MNIVRALHQEVVVDCALVLFATAGLVALYWVLAARYERRKREGERPWGDVPRDPRS